MMVLEGKNDQFEHLFLDLSEKVLANEEGALVYALHRSKSNPQDYVVMEQYRSAADIDHHGKTDYFRAASKAIGSLLAAAPIIEVLDQV